MAQIRVPTVTALSCAVLLVLAAHGGRGLATHPARSLGDESVVNFEDYPDVHDSHDQNFFVRLDDTPGNARLVLSFGVDSDGDQPGDGGHAPNALGVEWETGILTSARKGDGQFFPKWAWPVAGDHVWVNGYWTFDCGHAVPNDTTGEKGVRSEIHPPRAIASRRTQVATAPGSTAPIAVTAADLYVHGRAGVIVDLLECGGRVILGPGEAVAPRRCTHRNNRHETYRYAPTAPPELLHRHSEMALRRIALPVSLRTTRPPRGATEAPPLRRTLLPRGLRARCCRGSR